MTTNSVNVNMGVVEFFGGGSVGSEGGVDSVRPTPFREMGARIRAARKTMGYSQERLAELTTAALGGVDSLEQAALSKYERGETQIGAIVLAALAGVLGRPQAWFTSGLSDPPVDGSGTHEHGSGETTALGFRRIRYYEEPPAIPDDPEAEKRGATLEDQVGAVDVPEWVLDEIGLPDGQVRALRMEEAVMASTIPKGNVVLFDTAATTITRSGIYALRLGSALVFRRVDPRPGGKVQISTDEDRGGYAATATDLEVVGRALRTGSWRDL